MDSDFTDACTIGLMVWHRKDFPREDKMSDLLFRTLKRYKIISKLGSGGMGSVYKGLDTALKRDVAIKVMHDQFAADPEFRDRFLQEAQVTASLDHSGIVKVYDFDEHQGNLFIVMEFIPGDNLGAMLRELRKQNKWIVQKEGIEIVRQIAIALYYAHQQGILHRDIKPDNIMFKPQPSAELPYTPVITDLGLAKLASGGVTTQYGISMGTPAYMSPEQALGEEIDERSDVYSLGILLYELTVGKLPFPIKSLSEAIKYHTKEPPPPPSSIRSNFPAHLEKVILNAMEKAPEKRYKDTLTLARALSEIAISQDEPDEPVATEVSNISLVTQYKASLQQPKGESILDGFQPPLDLSENKIQILKPDTTIHTFKVVKSSITIGRGAGNDIVLDDQQASRRHAAVEIRDGNFMVMDLSSTNGTYLMNTRLLPGIAEQWSPENLLRIGDTCLRLLLADKTAKIDLVSLPDHAPRHPLSQTNADLNVVVSGANKGRIGVSLDTPNLLVEPGGSASLVIALINLGSVVDHFHINLSGIPEDWVSSRLQPVQLMPGDKQNVNIVIQVPRAPKIKAGKYTISTCISSQSEPGNVTVVDTSITVGVFSSFTCDFQPKKIRANQPAKLVISNTGNADEVFSVQFTDRGNELSFTPSFKQLCVVNNSSSYIGFHAQPKKRRLLGTSQTHPVTAQVSSSKSATQTISGEVISHARFSPGLLAFVIACMLFLCAGILFLGNRWVVSTQKATQTKASMIAFASQSTKDALVTSTEQAKTVEAAGDNDGDGLSNIEERSLGTNPNKPDTDDDGLTDFDETKIYGTDPLNQDSDGDTLLDGQEVNVLHTSPKLPDTDGDKIPDNVDPDPGKPPTFTPTFTTTPTPTSTYTLTPTFVPTNTATQTATLTPTATRVTYSLDDSNVVKIVIGGLEGGVPMSITCAGGNVVTGLYGLSGDLVNRIGLRCSTLNSDGTTGNSYQTDFRGGSGGSPFQLDCPSSQFFIGLKGRSGNYIDQIQGRCSNIDNSLTSETTIAGGGGGVPFDYICPANYAITGIEGRAGSFIDKLVIVCTKIEKR